MGKRKLEPYRDDEHVPICGGNLPRERDMSIDHEKRFEEFHRPPLAGGAVFTCEWIDKAYEAGLRGMEIGEYLRMREKGQSHNIASVLASKKFPGVKSDKIFCEGWFSGSSGRNHAEQLWLKKQAEAAGVSFDGSRYMRGLADYPGDPSAFVSSRSDVLRVAKMKNMTVHGYVEHQADVHDPAPETGPLVADDIIDAETDDIVSLNPGEFAHIREQIRADVYQHRAGLVDDNPLLVDDSPQVIPGPDL